MVKVNKVIYKDANGQKLTDEIDSKKPMTEDEVEDWLYKHSGRTGIRIIDVTHVAEESVKKEGYVNKVIYKDAFDCLCGNKDPKKTYEYDGALGYEAIICTVCGRIHDTSGVHPADSFSKKFIKKESFSKNQMDALGIPYNEKLSDSEYNDILKDIKEIKINQVEGKNDDPRLGKWFSFRTPSEVDRHLSSSEKPNGGYNKHDVHIILNDGNIIKNFRYDHGKNDPVFSKQMEWYLKNRLTRN